MAEAMDLTENDLPEYEGYFWVPGFLRAERRNADAEIANVSIVLESLDAEYDRLQTKKKKLQEAQMALDDQIAAAEFRKAKTQATLALVQAQIRKLKTPSPSSDSEGSGRSPDCPPV